MWKLKVNIYIEPRLCIIAKNVVIVIMYYLNVCLKERKILKMTNFRKTENIEMNFYVQGMFFIQSLLSFLLIS